MIRRELNGASREMAADPSVMHEGLMNMLGVSWPNGARANTGLRDSSHKVDIDSELMAPPPPPNVRACTVPLLGRVQVIDGLIVYKLQLLTVVTTCEYSTDNTLGHVCQSLCPVRVVTFESLHVETSWFGQSVE